MKMNVQIEAWQRESELSKKERAKLQVRFDSEMLEMKKTCQRAERRATKAQEEVKETEDHLNKLKLNLTKEVERLKEPLATEIAKMVWENKHLSDQFESSKTDYRDLVGDFLKIIN
jgi:hypothetical protein